MNVNEQLAAWGEPPVAADEPLLMDALDQAMVEQDQGRPFDLSSWLENQPALQQSGERILEAVEGLNQLAASVLDHSGLLQYLTTPAVTEPPTGPPVPTESPATSPPDPFPGHYRLLRELGSGGFGKVWLAQHLHLRKEVAIKTLFVKRIRDLDAALDSLVNDALVLGQINHPNIVKVHDFRPADGRWWLIMDYVPGCGLHKRIDEGRKLPWQLAARYVADVGEALLAVHSRGIVHRDIKPANILWDPVRDEALLTDFGLAARLTDEPGGGGTYAFMSPEAFSGKITTASDVYGLAATLFCLITGQAPFLGRSPDEFLRLSQIGLPARDPRFAEMPERLEEVIRAGLSVEGARRPALAAFVGTLRGALNQLLADAMASQHVAGQAAVDLRVLVTRQRADRQGGEVLAATQGPPRAMTRDLTHVPPPPERVIVRTGERVTIQVISSREGFLSVFNVGPRGNLNLLFPQRQAPGTTAPQIPAHRPIHILDVQLTPPAGVERVFAVWSSRALPAAPEEWRRLTGEASVQYRATRDLQGLQGSVEQLQPHEWHCVVLELDHQPA